MKKVSKKLKLSAILCSMFLIAVSSFVFLNVEQKTAFAYILSASREVYQGYATPAHWYHDNLHVSDKPLITVLTHGLGQRASTWSNNYGSTSSTAPFGFAYDSSSLIERLRAEKGANVFWAEMATTTTFRLMELKTLSNELDRYYSTPDPSPTTSRLPTITHLTIDDFSKHIIIVFEATPNGRVGSNDDVYGELSAMLNRIVRDTAYLTGGVYPKINLIGHSRGGITNLMYATEYPRLIDGLFSIGTPYFGSNFGRINLFAEAMKMRNFTDPTKDSQGFLNIQNETMQDKLMIDWNSCRITRGSHIKFYPMAGYSNVDFLQEVVNSVSDWSMFGGKANIEQLLFGFQQYVTLIWPLAKQQIIDGIRAQETGNTPKTDESIISDTLKALKANNLLYPKIVTIEDDLFVSKDSQLAYKDSSTCYAGITQTFEKFYSSLSKADLSKVSQDAPPIIHNLEARDSFFIDKILSVINVGLFTADQIHSHRFTYETINKDSHRSHCQSCGLIKDESHTLKLYGIFDGVKAYQCTKCYMIDYGKIQTWSKPEEEQIS